MAKRHPPFFALKISEASVGSGHGTYQSELREP